MFKLVQDEEILMDYENRTNVVIIIGKVTFKMSSASFVKNGKLTLDKFGR